MSSQVDTISLALDADIDLKLKAAEVQTLMEGLKLLPLGRSMDLYNKVMGQVAQQAQGGLRAVPTEPPDQQA